MVGKILRFCSARACLRALDRTLTEGRASAGTGVDRPLFNGDALVSCDVSLPRGCSMCSWDRGPGGVRTLSDLWLYRSHYDPDIRWCWPRYSKSAAKAANGLACAAVVAICRRSGRGSLRRKPCSAQKHGWRTRRAVDRRQVSGSKARELSSYRRRRETGGTMRRTWEERIDYSSRRSSKVIRGGMGASTEGTLIIARVNKLC